MSYLNLQYGLISYKDQQSYNNPKIRLGGDISKSFQQVTTANANTKEHCLAPGETREIVTTLRSTGLSATSELQFLRAFDDRDPIRLKWTGVGSNPLFRTKRAISVDATTEITTTRVAPNTVRLQSTAGTAMVTTNIQIGDIFKLEKTTDVFTNPFNSVNTGIMFTVQSKGSNYIDIIDNQLFTLEQSPIVLGIDFDFAFRVFSPGSVKIGDSINIDGSTINPSNKGVFVVTDLSSDYLEFTNSYGVEETITNTDNLIKIYDYLIGFVHIIGRGGSYKLKINDQQAFEVDTLGIDSAMGAGLESLFLGSVKAYKIEAINEGSSQIDIDVQIAAVVK